MTVWIAGTIFTLTYVGMATGRMAGLTIVSMIIATLWPWAIGVLAW